MSMMKIDLICSVIILVNVLVNIVTATVRGNLALSEHQIDQLCMKINKMKLLSKSEDEIEKYLKEELDHLVIESLRTELNNRAKGYDSLDYANKDGNNNGQKVDIESKDVVGEKAMLNTIKLIGTGNSMGDHSRLLIVQETNNEFESSEAKYFNAFILAPVSVGQRNGNQSETRVEDRKGSLQLRLKIDDKIPLSYDKCKKMIQNVHNETIHSRDSIKNLPNFATEMGKNAGISSIERADSTGRGNSTSIDTEYVAGPDSFVTYLLHSSRGNATISAFNDYVENQSHENLENSKVELINLVTGAVVSR